MKKIDFSANMAFFRGAVAPMQRMNQKLSDFYQQPEAWKVRAACASGVQIVFATDAVDLRWECKFGEAARQIFTTDIFVDGKLTTLEGAGPHDLKLLPGNKLVEISLPHLVVLTDYALWINEEAEVKTVAEKRPQLLVCGDSIMQGMTCSSPSRAAVAIAARELGMVLHNVSVGGVIMRPETVRDSLKLGGDIVLVALGVNDISHKTPPDVFRERTFQVLEMLNDFPGRSFIVTPISSTREELEEGIKVISGIIREEHKKFPRVNLIEGTSFFPADDALLCDQLHPNDEGMAIYGKALIEALRNR